MEGSKGVREFSPAEVEALPEGLAPSLADAVREEIRHLKLFVASQDADVVRKATKGLGTDEALIIDVLCARTKSQMEACSAAMVKKAGKTLREVVAKDLSGNLGKLIGYSLMDVDDFGAECFTKATKGMGTDESALIDLCMTRTNDELKAIKEKWEARNDASMVDTLKSEFGTFSKHARHLFTKLFLAQRGECEEVDEVAAEDLAEKLYKAGVGKRFGTDEDVFINILVESSRPQVQAIAKAYERKYSQSLRNAIEKEMSGALEQCLVALLQPSIPAYVALALHQAFEGMGCDKDRVCRLLGGTDKQLIPDVSARYLDVYGKTVEESLKDEMSVIGDFKAAAIQWLRAYDPTKGIEFRPPPEGEKNVLNHLLEERENLRDHIARDDANIIARAVKGWGTDDTSLIGVICTRPKLHLKRVDRWYHELFHESLRDAVKSDCSGDYKRLLLAALSPQDDFDAEVVKAACDGLGTNERVLVEMFAPRSNARISAMKEKYEARYGQPLIDRLNSELSGDLRDVIVQLLKAERREDEPADEEHAAVQAARLHEAGVDSWGTDEEVFIEILCLSSRAQIKAICASYESQFGISLRRAIDKETSGDMERALLALVKQPADFYVGVLRKAIEGWGTDESALVRVLGGHDKSDLKEITELYLETTGRTLTEDLKKEIRGNFLKAALQWVSSADPLNLTALDEAAKEAEACVMSQAGSTEGLGGEASQATMPTLASSGSTLALGQNESALLPNDLGDEFLMGLGWETESKVDLDAGVICLDAGNQPRSIVFYDRRTEPGIYHSGDSRNGDRKGDDEVIRIRPGELNPAYATLVFTVHCYNEGDSFSAVRASHIRMSLPTGHVCAEMRLDGITTPGVVFAMLKRVPGTENWIFAGLGRGVMGNAANSMDTIRAVQAMNSSARVLLGSVA